jgi:hypothetical protein
MNNSDSTSKKQQLHSQVSQKIEMTCQLGCLLFHKESCCVLQCDVCECRACRSAVNIINGHASKRCLPFLSVLTMNTHASIDMLCAQLLPV